MLAYILMLALAPPAGDYMIKSYDRPMLHVYDVNGQFLREQPASSLPPNAPIKAPNAVGYLGIEVDGKTIYLRNAEITTTDHRPDCEQITPGVKKSGTSQDATPGANAPTGVSSGLSAHTLSCPKLSGSGAK
jgi:hypothetical protein